MSYILEPYSHISDKLKIVLYQSSYTTKNELKHTAGVDTCYLDAKKDFVALKDVVGRLDINELVKVPTSLNNLKTKLDDLAVGKLKTVLEDVTKLSDLVDKRVVKNTKFDTLNTKVNNLEKKIPSTTTLIYINQYKTDEQILEKKFKDFDKKYQELVVRQQLLF